MNIISGIGESGFLAHSAFSAGIATKDSNGNDITATYLTGVDLTPYQLTADMTAYQPVGSYLTTGDSANFYTTANESGYLTAVPDTYLQNTDLSTTDGKVTAISGIPLSAGGDVPEGVMVESGLEYNAVNEISGYNGSAIAQYGAEKQWLVHDDTLVHASNSAQYALGVAIDNVARLLHIDETVLWSGAGTTACTLSESPSAFDRIRFYGYRNEDTLANSRGVFEFPTEGMTGYDLSQFLYNSEANARIIYLSRYAITGTSCTLYKAQHLWTTTGATTWTGSGTVPIVLYKIVGIGRKS